MNPAVTVRHPSSKSFHKITSQSWNVGGVGSSRVTGNSSGLPYATSDEVCFKHLCCVLCLFTLLSPVAPSSDTGPPLLQHVVSPADPQLFPHSHGLLFWIIFTPASRC
uniref:Uncharacterized protein n=1 Tax=Mesocestoides corti TaxID=53468 RepID=A0A5K3FQ85_MESCO